MEAFSASTRAHGGAHRRCQFKSSGKQVQQLTGRDALVCYPTPWIRPLRKANIKRAQNPVVLSSVTRLVERKGIDRVQEGSCVHIASS